MKLLFAGLFILVQCGCYGLSRFPIEPCNYADGARPLARYELGFPAASNVIRCGQFSSDGSLLVLGTIDKSLSIWDTETLLQTHHISDLDGTPERMVVFGNITDIVVHTTAASQMEIYHLIGGVPNLIRRYYSSPVVSMAYNADRVAISCSDGVIDLWNVHSDATVFRKRVLPKGADLMALDTKGSLLACCKGSVLTTINCRDSTVRTVVIDQYETISDLRFIDDSTDIMVCESNGALILYDGTQGSIVKRYRTGAAYSATEIAGSNRVIAAADGYICESNIRYESPRRLFAYRGSDVLVDTVNHIWRVTDTDVMMWHSLRLGDSMLDVWDLNRGIKLQNLGPSTRVPLISRDRRLVCQLDQQAVLWGLGRRGYVLRGILPFWRKMDP